MRQFNSFIEDHGLVDFLLKDFVFTWANNHERKACSRIDRFLFTHDWMEQAPLFSQEALLNPVFDHLSILFRVDELPSGPWPFRFELM